MMLVVLSRVSAGKSFIPYGDAIMMSGYATKLILQGGFTGRGRRISFVDTYALAGRPGL